MRTITSLRVCVLLSFSGMLPCVFAEVESSQIKWNADNKAKARLIHELTSRVYRSDLDPQEMKADMDELVKILAASPFSDVPGMEEFQVCANAMYSWRTSEVGLEKTESKTHEKSSEKEVSGEVIVVGPLVDIEAKYRSLINEVRSKNSSERISLLSNAQKIEELGEAWRQSYRLLLTSLANRGFSPPVDRSMIVGTWRWKRSDAAFTFTFNNDGTMQAIIDPKNPEDWPGGGWVNEGKGTWDVDYNRLDVQMNKVWVGVFWKDHRVTWFDDTVNSVSKDTIVLSRVTDNELKRVGASKGGK